MKELTFKHELNQEMVDKARMKFDKMVETEIGRKFFAHLVKAFIQSGTERKLDVIVSDNDPSQTIAFTQCDLTHAKLVTLEEYNRFKAIYNAKINMFERMENESDEDFEKRKTAYIVSFRSSNPYACNEDIAYVADRSDKKLSIEAITALIQKYQEVVQNPEEYAELNKLVEVRIPKKFKKKTDKKSKSDKTKDNKPKNPKPKNPKATKVAYTTKTDKTLGNTLGNLPGFDKLRNVTFKD